MRVAFGLKAHSGWAALVVLGAGRGGLEIVDRRRLELVDEEDAAWAKQPYHAAEHLKADEARDLVGRGIASARRIAVREMRAALERARDAGHRVAGCAVLMGDPMPGWTVGEILAVHFRMHKAEGVLFRDVLARAAGACGVRFVGILEKRLVDQPAGLRTTIAALGRSAGPPWGKDQKDAALAAMIALKGRTRRPA